MKLHKSGPKGRATQSLFLLDASQPRFTSLLYRLHSISKFAPDILKRAFMLDVILLILGLGLFVVSIAYAYACDRL
jgi:hypothetical protein